MGTRFKIHTAHETTVPVEVDFKGAKAVAALPAMLVEMVGIEPYQRSFTHVELIDTPEKLAAARKAFRVDQVIEMGLAPVEDE